MGWIKNIPDVISKNKSERFILPAILLLGLAFRLYHFDFLLPYFDFPDERWLAEPALNIVKTWDFNPHFFKYGSFPICWTALLYGLVLGIRCWASAGASPIGECIRNFGIHDDGSLLFYVGRLTSIGFGIASIYLTYLLGRKIFGKKIGYLSAFFLATSPYHIWYSQIFKIDSSFLFWVLLTFYYAYKIYERGNIKDFLFGGLFLGLSLSTRYNFWIFLPLLVAGLARDGLRTFRDWRFWFMGYLAALVFFLTSPFFFLDFPEAFNQLTVEIGEIQQASDPLLGKWPIFFNYGLQYIFLFPLLLGPLYLAAIGGLGVGFSRNRPPVLIFGSFMLIYTLFVGAAFNLITPTKFVPVIPLVLLMGVYFLDFLMQQQKKGLILFGNIGLILSLAFHLGVSAMGCWQKGFLVYDDLGGWIEKNIPKNSSVLSCYGPFFPTERLNFDREERVVLLKRFPANALQEFNPDYVILFQETAIAPKVGKVYPEYWQTLSGLLEGDFPDYQIIKEFKLPGWLEAMEKYAPSLPRFRAMVFKKDTVNREIIKERAAN